MLELIRKLISDRWIKVRVGRSTPQNRQRDLGILQEVILGEALFLVAINVILGKLRNGVNGPLFTDDLAICILQQ